MQLALACQPRALAPLAPNQMDALHTHVCASGLKRHLSQPPSFKRTKAYRACEVRAEKGYRGAEHCVLSDYG